MKQFTKQFTLKKLILLPILFLNFIHSDSSFTISILGGGAFNPFNNNFDHDENLEPVNSSLINKTFNFGFKANLGLIRQDTWEFGIVFGLLCFGKEYRTLKNDKDKSKPIQGSLLFQKQHTPSIGLYLQTIFQDFIKVSLSISGTYNKENILLQTSEDTMKINNDTLYDSFPLEASGMGLGIMPAIEIGIIFNDDLTLFILIGCNIVPSSENTFKSENKLLAFIQEAKKFHINNITPVVMIGFSFQLKS